MKRTGFIVMIISLMCCLPAQAQLGDLISKGAAAVYKAKQAKQAVDDISKKANGDIDFYCNDKHMGFYRSKTGKIVFDERHEKGALKGKNIIYTINKNGDVIYDEGEKIAELLRGGVVNCQDCSPYLTLVANGDVMMDGEVIGHIDKNGNVTLDDMTIGRAKGLDRQIAAYIFFGVFNDKELIAQRRQRNKERAEEAKKQAAENHNNQSSGNKNTTSQTVREWKIEKNGKTGYVDANGVVYDWRHNKLGQLPKGGSGSINDLYGQSIGRINMGDIYDRSGKKLATVSSGGSISLPGSNATVAEVRGGGRIDWTKDSKTIGYCDVRPYEWAVVLVFCDFFKF